VGWRMWDVGWRMLDVGWRMLDVGCIILIVEWWLFFTRKNPSFEMLSMSVPGLSLADYGPKTSTSQK